jgi:hypothetical protein
MIGSIRKHSAWLWWVVAGLTILSFVIFMGQGGMRGGAMRNGGLGMIYGKPVTPENFEAAKRSFYIDFWRRNNGQFPDQHVNRLDIERNTYVHLLLMQKAEILNIQVSDEAMAEHAREILRSVGNGRDVPFDQFLQHVLQPNGFDAADFQRYVRDDLTIQQLVLTLGLPGLLVPPQEIGQLYDHDHQEVSAQAVFFSATNYLSQVSVTPAAIAQFYTNNMAAYRLPDRVQVNYLEFQLTNYLAAAEQKLGKTNLASQVDAYFAQKGLEAVPGAKTADEAKAKIREYMLRQTAQSLAVEDARQFDRELFAKTPVAPENLVALAKQKNIAVQTTAPFSETDGPQEFPAPADVTATAFKLNADSPFSKPLAGAEAVYVIGLAKQLPSTVQPLDAIRAQATEDFQHHQAAINARAAGTNFYYNAAVQIAAGSTFAKTAIAAGQAPVALTPFSLSSSQLPEAEAHAELNDIKRAAFFETQPGHMSPFVPTADGGFVLFVQSLLPVDETQKKSDLPMFSLQLRRQRENEAFNIWLQTEANHEIGGILKQLAEQEQGSSAAK